MDCKLPGSSVHGIFQARVLEWVAISFSRGSSQPRDRTWVSCIAGRPLSHQGSPHVGAQQSVVCVAGVVKTGWPVSSRRWHLGTPRLRVREEHPEGLGAG